MPTKFTLFANNVALSTICRFHDIVLGSSSATSLFLNFVRFSALYVLIKKIHIKNMCTNQFMTTVSCLFKDKRQIQRKYKADFHEDCFHLIFCRDYETICNFSSKLNSEEFELGKFWIRKYFELEKCWTRKILNSESFEFGNFEYGNVCPFSAFVQTWSAHKIFE